MDVLFLALRESSRIVGYSKSSEFYNYYLKQKSWFKFIYQGGFKKCFFTPLPEGSTHCSLTVIIHEYGEDGKTYFAQGFSFRVMVGK